VFPSLPLASAKALSDVKDELTWFIKMEHMTDDFELATVHKICVMLVPMKQMNFFSRRLRIQNAILSKMVGWTFPRERMAR
jgi:hypothetical protein